MQLVLELMAAYDRGDFAAMTGMLHPDAELHEWPEGPDSRVYHGTGSITQARETWAEAWEWVTAEIVEVIDVGNRVLLGMHNRGKGRGSAVEVELDTYGVYTVLDGKVSKVQLFTDRDTARATAAVEVRELNDLLVKGDLDELAKRLRPDTVWDHNPGSGSPEEGLYRGLESIVGLLRRLREAWDEIDVQPRDVRILGPGEYEVSGDVTFRHTASESEITEPFEEHLELRDGLLVRGRLTIGTRAARVGAGADSEERAT